MSVGFLKQKRPIKPVKIKTKRNIFQIRTNCYPCSLSMSQISILVYIDKAK